MAALVRVEGLEHRYGERQALRGVSFEVQAGETFGLLGPNGGGKSTTFRILSTYFAPTAGTAWIFGMDVRHNTAAIRRRLGIVFQNPSLDAKLTVEENMRHQGQLYGLRGADLLKRIEEMLGRYGLIDRRAELVSSLSGGLRRRVELAKGLLHNPELILLDEPSTGLDPAARREMWDHLKDLKRRGNVTLIVTTHLMDEAEHCDNLVLLDRGQIAAAGKPAALKAKIGGDIIAIESDNPEDLNNLVREKFGPDGSIVDGVLRLERPNGHAFIPQLVEAFPGKIRSISLAKPSLEDVFIRHTGRSFST